MCSAPLPVGSLAAGESQRPGDHSMAGYEYSQPLRHPPLWKWFCKSRTTGHVFPSSVLNAMLMGCFRPQELEFVNISTSAPEGSSAAMTALLLLGRPVGFGVFQFRPSSSDEEQ